MKNFIYKNKFPLSIILICIVVAAANYQPGTILSGWDTLHPEFNFPEYFKRIFFGVWQQHQGLGALATQSHAGEIPRIIIYYLLSFITPDSVLRYLNFFITLVLGPVGAFFFLKKVFKENEHREIISFSGSLFYLLNLVVVQQFYVPLEMFTIHFAAIPWLFLYSIKYLEKNSNKNLLLFAIVSLFSSAMSHTSTLWYVYFFTFSLFLFCFATLRRKKEFFKRSFILILTALLTNIFWILPNLYFIVSSAADVQNSKIHSLFSEEAFAQNASFGTIGDLFLFKNFLFNWGEYNYNGQFVRLLDEWIIHLQNPFVQFIGYSLSIASIIGIFYSIKKRNIIATAMLPILVICIFFWMNINPPFGTFFSLLQERLEFFREAFRFPFTKFSILLIFAASIYFSFTIALIADLFKKFSKSRPLIQLIPFLIFFVLSFYMFPAFKGNLISPSMKVNIPNEYSQLFKWFQDQPQKRIVSLPINSFWGWTYYNWNYQGAGFLWFGIPQPILDREFDRWSPYNEEYYREMSQAIYSKDYKTFNSLLNKYDVGYVLLDENIIAPGPGNNTETLFYKEIEEILKKETQLTKVWHKGSISVYEKDYTSSPVYLLKNAPSISPKSKSLYNDFVYFDNGDYITSKNSNYLFPLRNTADNQNRLIATEDQKGIIFKLGENNESYNFPPFSEYEKNVNSDLIIEKTNENISVKIYINSPDGTKIDPISFNSQFPNGRGVISINKTYNFSVDESILQNAPFFLGQVLINLSAFNTINLYPDNNQLSINFNPFNTKYTFENCGLLEKEASFGINGKENGFTFFGENSQVCLFSPLAKIINSNNKKPVGKFLLTLNYKFKGGNQSNLCLMKKSEGKCKYLFNNLNAENSQTIEADLAEIDDLYIKIFLDSTASKKVVSYEDFNLKISSPISENLIDGQNIVSNFTTTRKNISEIIFPFSGNESLSIPITSLPKTGGPCSLVNYKNSLPLKRDIITKEGEGYIRYSSEEGSFCDHFSYPDLSHNQGYIVTINARNIKGLPLRLCITNSVSKRCDLYTHLTDKNSFKKEFFLLPPIGSGTGYDININNFAIKNYPSINDLQSIEIIPFPYNWASRIHSGSNIETKSIRSDLINTKEYNPSLYSTSSKFINGDVVVLSQSFDKGWKLYKIDSLNILSLSLPFVFGKEFGEHVIVNNWANGWLFDKNYKGTVIMVYLPQYLEYLGLLLVFLCLLFVLRPKSLFLKLKSMIKSAPKVDNNSKF